MTSDDAGFTLVETLVGLAVAGLIVATLGYLVQGLQTSRLRVAAYSNVQEEVLAAHRLLQTVVGLAEPSPETGADWSADRAVLLSRGPQILAAAEPIAFTLRVSRTDRGYELSVAFEDPQGRQLVQRQLMGNARSITLAYFGSDSPGAEPRWRDHWRVAGQVPLAIRLTFDSAEVGFPAALVYRTHMAHPGVCFVDPGLTACEARP